MTKKEIELASIISRWTADEDEEMFRVVTKAESGKNEEEESSENVLQ